MHSLVAAARIGSSEALDVLLEAGADASAWIKTVALASPPPCGLLSSH